MSDPELQRGLLGTCVASRCSVLSNPEDRVLVWFLQRLSYQPGGICAAVEEMIELWPDRFATSEMKRIGRKANGEYSAEEVRRLIEGAEASFSASTDHAAGAQYIQRLRSRSARKEHFAAFDATGGATSVCAFVELCRKAALGSLDESGGLADFIFKELCLDPACTPGNWRTWYCPDLRQMLLDYKERYITTAASKLALTEVTEKIFEAFDYALAVRGLVVVQGLERRGKTVSAQTWCDMHPGEVRYVKTPSTSDDVGFFREIARSLGIGCGHSLKTVQLRERIEDVLSSGDLMLVFDNAHNLFRQSMYRNAVPHRLTWILTALVDEGIPVAFVATPQFTVAQQLTVERSKWRDGQLTGRIEHFAQLPDKLSIADLERVARACLPGADAESINFLVTYARSSTKYLQAIGSLAQRAQYLVRKAGRDLPTSDDLKAALVDAEIPSDRAIAEAMDAARTSVCPRGGRRSTASKVRLSQVEQLDRSASAPAADRSGVDDRAATATLIPDRNFSRASGSILNESIAAEG